MTRNLQWREVFRLAAVYHRLMKPLIAIVIMYGVVAGQSVETPPHFDSADVHISGPATNPYTLMSGGVLRGTRYDLRKATMLDLIRTAYGIEADTIYGGPNWMELDRFDIAAKAPGSTPPETIALMLRNLLADRFKLALHEDTKPIPAFVLTVGKGKPTLKPTATSNDPGCQYHQPESGSTFATVACHNMTMKSFARELRGMANDYLPNLVVDSTNLEGAWDFDLKWNPRSQLLTGLAERTTIFDAIDRLGLALRFQSVPSPVVVVDRVNEKPTDNPPGVAEMLPPRELEFEVADIKPSRPDESGSFGVTPGGGLAARGIEMKILISTAWDVDWDHADELIAGLPKWTDSARFDINAKAPEPGNAPPLRGSGFIDDEVRLMLRNLLIDRFKIKTHVENRLVNAYTLVAAKPRLKKADSTSRSSCKDAPVVEKDPRDLNPKLSRLVSCRNITMAQFATQLQRIAAGYIAYPVEDATDISGPWDFTLNFTPFYQLGSPGNTGQPGGTGAAPDPNGALSLFDALSKQLGLKLELRKRSLPIVVIDHIEEKPTEN